jgi:hypothetical protein
MATTLGYYFWYISINNCWVCIRASFCNNLPLDFIWLYIHAFILQWKLEMKMVAIKGQKALNQAIVQSMSIIDKRQLLSKAKREWLHIEVHEQDDIRFNFGKETRENYPQTDGRFTYINLSCYSCFSSSILMIFN